MLHGATKECFLVNCGVKQTKQHTEGEDQARGNERWSVASVTRFEFILIIWHSTLCLFVIIQV